MVSDTTWYSKYVVSKKKKYFYKKNKKKWPQVDIFLCKIYFLFGYNKFRVQH